MKAPYAIGGVKGRLTLVVALGVVAAVPAVGVGPLREDPPTVQPPRAGSLHGVVRPADRIAGLTAVSRVTRKRYEPKTFDHKSGALVLDDLPGDAAYDLCLTMTDGRRVEGIDLSWVEARLARLADERRVRLGLPEPPGPREFTRRDANELIDLVSRRPDFFDVSRILHLRGLGDRAVALTERVRTREFHGRRDGETIWRTDLQYFTYAAGGWKLQANTDRLVERRRFTPDQCASVALVYDPALSGYVDPNGHSEPIRYTLGERIDEGAGRIAAGPRGLVAAPVVWGLPVATSRPAATAPARRPD